MLAVEQAQLGYGRNVVLKNVSVQIRQGEFWCLLGPNGEGKTTFIKALLGAIRPLHGKIFLRTDFANRKRLEQAETGLYRRLVDPKVRDHHGTCRLQRSNGAGLATIRSTSPGCFLTSRRIR